MRGRRGLSEVLGAFIVITAVVVASIAVSTAMSKATQRTIEALEGASSVQKLAVIPVAAGPRLEVSVAPLQPGEQVTVMVVDPRGVVLAERSFKANSTIARIVVLEGYDCRPVYIVAITSEGRVGFFDRRDLGMPVNETLDPRLYTCTASASSVGAIIDPVTGARATVASIVPAAANIDFKPVNETVYFTVGLRSSVQNHLGLELAVVSANIRAYINGSLVTIGPVSLNEFVQVHQGRVNVSVGVLYDSTYDFAIVVARIDGPSDLYLINATVGVSGSTTRVTLAPIGTPYFTAAPLLYSLTQNTTLYLLNYRERYTGGYYYYITGSTKGYLVAGNAIVIGYASFYYLDMAVGFKVTLNIVGEANYSVGWARHQDYYVGTVAPGEPIRISLESLAFKIASPTWQDSPATKLLEAAPLYPHTLQLVLESPNGKVETTDISFGNTTIVASDYYRVYLRVWETPPIIAYSSWEINVTETSTITTLTRIWRGNPSQYPALNPTLPPWIVRIKTSNHEANIIVAYTATPRDGAAAYIANETPPGACTFPSSPWQDPLVRWVPRTCNPPDAGTRVVVTPVAPRAISITLAGEEILTIQLYEIRILQSP